MTIFNIAVYLLLGLLGMGFMGLAIIVVSYGYLKNEERMMEQFIKFETQDANS